MKKNYYLDEQTSRLSRTVTRDVLKEGVFADTPRNWLIHSRGFYHASCQLIGVINANEEQFPKIITDEMFFHHRYSCKIAVYLLSHAIELLLKASVSYYNLNNPSNALEKPAFYGHRVEKMLSELIRVGYIEKNEDDEEIIGLISTYLIWFGRYYCPNERHVDKVLEEDYIEDENQFLEFRHDLSGAYEKLIVFHKRIESQIKLGNLFFHYSFQAP